MAPELYQKKQYGKVIIDYEGLEYLLVLVACRFMELWNNFIHAFIRRKAPFVRIS